jgi:hypothetical protein
MNKIILKLNKTDSIIEADPLHSGLRILDWILHIVCGNEIKRIKSKVTLRTNHACMPWPRLY